MAKRLLVSVSDEFEAWLIDLAEESGIGKATMATILLNEAKRSRENAMQVKSMFEKLQSISSDEFKRMINSDFDKLKLEIESKKI